MVYHSKSGKNRAMAEAVYRGATHQDVSDVEVRFKQAADADADDLRWADGILFGTPENFGYMSGALKDFFDRTFYEVEGEVDGKPYCLFVGSGNDGQGAIMSVHRICLGYNFREVQEPLLVIGDLSDGDIERCEELGMGFAMGLEAGIF